MDDLLPKESHYWKRIMQAALDVSRTHSLNYIEFPPFEKASILKKAKKLKTEDGKKVALKSDLLVSVFRSYIEHQLGHFSLPLRLFYISQVFSKEDNFEISRRLGFSILGDNDPIYDGEIVLAVLDFFKALKLEPFPEFFVGNIGCRICSRGHREKLVKYFQCYCSGLCNDCREKLKNKSFYEIFSCVNGGCKEILANAPVALDYLCLHCNNQFLNVLEFLENSGIAYNLKPGLMRSPLWYNRTIFEFSSSGVPLVLGGRCDYLSEDVFSKSVPGVGAEIKIENIIKNMSAEKCLKKEKKEKKKIFFVAVGSDAKKASLKIINELRQEGIIVSESLSKNSLNAQLKRASKYEASSVIILGQKELFEGVIIVRDTKTGSQERVVLDSLVKEAKKRLK